MTDQQQFLDVIDRDEAERRFRSELAWQPLGEELVALEECLGRTLARDVIAQTNVPSFDRSNYDGFAVRAADTIGADEQNPRTLRLLAEQLDPGVISQSEIQPGEAIPIATGGMLPRGADSVVMVERCETNPNSADELLVRTVVHAGFGIAYAATDISCGETVLRIGQQLTSRETGVLAAIGVSKVAVYRKPRVAIISTGNEIVAPNAKMRPGLVYDSNARTLADAVRELGGVPLELGVVNDDLDKLRDKLQEGLHAADFVLLSGGTSKGQGDLSYRAVQELKDPGIVAHGVALKPGKPICLAISESKPVVILPGFPTSAIFTFHEFVAPVIQMFAGRQPRAAAQVDATMAVKVHSVIGRTEYLLVGLLEDSNARKTIALPMGKGSGSVTTFSQADGFVTIGRHQEIIEADSLVQVQLLGQATRQADLVVVGSHCVGLDYLLGELQRQGWRTKMMAVGSTAGLRAARFGQCDLAGIHLLDLETGEYNKPFVTPEVELLRGYTRRQGIVYRQGDARFENQSTHEAVRLACSSGDCRMVNRNQGSGTRILIDRLLKDADIENQPAGHSVQVNNHHAVVAAIEQGRADWGVAIESVVQAAGANQSTPLGFLWLDDERFDFAIPVSRKERPALVAFQELIKKAEHCQKLESLGFQISASEA